MHELMRVGVATPDVRSFTNQPAFRDGPETAVPEQRSPPCCSFFEDIPHVQGLIFREHAQCEKLLRFCIRRVRHPSGHVNRMSGQHIDEMLTSDVLERVGDSSTDCERPVLGCHPLAERADHPFPVVDVDIAQVDLQVSRCMGNQIRAMQHKPLPKPVANVPGSYSAIDCAECTEGWRGVGFLSSVEFVDLEIQLVNQISPRPKGESLLAMRDRACRTGHLRHQVLESREILPRKDRKTEDPRT